MIVSNNDNGSMEMRIRDLIREKKNIKIELKDVKKELEES